MKGTILDRWIIPGALAAVWVLSAGAIVVLAWRYAPEYEFFRVPIASWVVFVLLGLMLALDVAALYLWRALRRARTDLAAIRRALDGTSQELGELRSSPHEAHGPVVRGHERLKQPEFVVLLQSLFGPPLDIRYVHVDSSLTGGYSGNYTVRVKLLRDAATCLPRPFVVKLGRRSEMAGENDKYRNYVLPALSRAARIFNYVEWQDVAGIAYEFASLDQDASVRSLDQLYRGDPRIEMAALVGQLYVYLEEAWYHGGQSEVVDLYQEYDLLRRKSQQIVAGVGQILDEDDPYRVNIGAAEEELRPKRKPRFCPALDIPWYDPVAFLGTWSRQSLRVPVHRAPVHGDLNARNVIVETGRDGQMRLWFIDFSHTGNGLSAVRAGEALDAGLPVEPGRGHTLRDFCRLEADVKFILTPLLNESDLRLAVLFEQELLMHGPKLDDLPATPLSNEVRLDERFQRAWQVVRAIRGRAARYLVHQDEPRPYYLSLLHATLPTVYYYPEQFASAESERQQKRYALLAAGMLCDRI